MKWPLKPLLLFGLALAVGNEALTADVKSPQERETTCGLASSADEAAFGSEFAENTQAQKPKSCDSFAEFQNAYEYLIKDNDLALNQQKAARVSLQVSQGCNGAAQRFFKAYEMMKKTGVALNKAVEVGLDFAILDDERLKNFTEVFSQMYLENVFNFDFPTAYKVSFALSKDYEGKARPVREDFVKLVKFCTASDKVALPLRQCADLALQLVEHSSKFPNGLYADFEKFYTFLREDKRLGYSVLEAYNLLPKVFAYGPKAPENFKKGLEYALSSNKITIDHKNAVNLALRLAEQSLPLPTPTPETHDVTKNKK